MITINIDCCIRMSFEKSIFSDYVIKNALKQMKTS